MNEPKSPADVLAELQAAKEGLIKSSGKLQVMFEQEAAQKMDTVEIDTSDMSDDAFVHNNPGFEKASPELMDQIFAFADSAPEPSVNEMRQAVDALYLESASAADKEPFDFRKATTVVEWFDSLGPGELMEAAAYTARMRGLRFEDAFDAALLAGYYIPQVQEIVGPVAMDAQSLVQLERTQWTIMLDMCQDALRGQDEEFRSPEELVPAFNKCLGAKLGGYLHYATAELSKLATPIHPVFAELEDEDKLDYAAKQLVVNATARVIAFMRSGLFHASCLMAAEASEEGMIFDRNKLLPMLGQKVSAYAVIEQSLIREFDMEDGGKTHPNVILEGWKTNEMGNPKQVWIGNVMKDKRGLTLTAAIMAMEAGAYPLKDGERAGQGYYDLHAFPQFVF